MKKLTRTEILIPAKDMRKFQYCYQCDICEHIEENHDKMQDHMMISHTEIIKRGGDNA